MRKHLLVLSFWIMEAIEAIAVPALAEGEHEIKVQSKQLIRDIPSLNEIEQPLTTAEGLLVQQPAPTPAPAQVTGVQLKPTDKGLEVILETTSEFAEVLNSETENSLITDIPNAQLRLPKGGAFRQDNSTQAIASVEVTNLDAKTLRVTVTGKSGVPTAEVSQSPQALILSVVAPPAPAAQPTPAPTVPPPETPAPPAEPQRPAAPETPAPGPQAEEELLELEVRAEEEAGGYSAPDATTATKTDTPIRDIPASIQVVPQQVLQDRNVRDLTEATETVSGVVPVQVLGLPAGAAYLRGFEQPRQFRNGYRDAPNRYSLVGIGTIERVEVLKGPASVLFGAAEPGGIVNTVTKQPLSDPYYKLDFEAGNRAFLQPSLDLSGPLNSDETLLYRFNASYQSSDGFQEFVTKDFLTIAPTITWKLGDRTTLDLDYEYLNFSGIYESYSFLASDGTKPPRNRFLEYPQFSNNNHTTQRYGYTLTHEFSDNLEIHSNFSALNSSFDDVYLFGTELVNDRSLKIRAIDDDSSQDNYFAEIDLLGKFNTGSISHEVLAGFDFNHYVDDSQYRISDSLPNLDPFNPDYDVPAPVFDPEVERYSATNSYGIFLQDQVTLLDNLKLLIGGRFDWVSQNAEEDGVASPEENNTAFSPRVGLVYQPIEPVSVYASYSQSFVPISGFSRTDRAFEPSRGTQYEVGVKTDFLDGRLSTTLAAYQITKTNVLTPDPEDRLFSIQTGEQRSRGIELDVSGEILPGWKVTAAYAFTNAEVTEDTTIPPIVGNQLPNAPENLASLWTTYSIQEGSLQGLGFGLGLFYVGNRQGDLANTFELGDYLRTDAAIFYRQGQFNAAINIRNLFNTDYFGVADGSNIYIRRGAPLTIVGSIGWEF